MAKAGWSLEQLRARASDSLVHYGGGVDEGQFAKLLDLLRYVDGDYNDRATFEKPGQTSVGMRFVIVSGTPVIRDGELVRAAMPGRAIRREVRARAAISSTAM